VRAARTERICSRLAAAAKKGRSEVAAGDDLEDLDGVVVVGQVPYTRAHSTPRPSDDRMIRRKRFRLPAMIDLPLREAELIRESDEPVAGAVQRVNGGWALHDRSGNVVLFDTELRARARIRIPDPFRNGGSYNWDIHPSGRWAAFAGLRHTTCVGPDGAVTWESDHPGLTNVDGDLILVSVGFHPFRDELHVFPGTKDDNCSQEDAGYESACWKISLPDAAVTKDESLRDDRWILFPNGLHSGQSSFDGHDIQGRCHRISDGTSSPGSSRPIDVHPDGTRWLGEAFGGLRTNPFDEPAGVDEDDEEENATDDDCYDEAFFLDRELVIAATDGPVTHELLDAETLRRVARVAYPLDDERWQWTASFGNGTWVTTSLAPGADSARLRHWRLA